VLPESRLFRSPLGKHGVTKSAAQGYLELDPPNLPPTKSKGQRHFPNVAPPSVRIFNSQFLIPSAPLRLCGENCLGPGPRAGAV
jgi:hypothetical protein